MMDGDRVRDLFCEYMEGDLEPDVEDQVREYLEANPGIREEYEEFRDTFESMRHLGSVAPPRDLENKIKKRIRARSRGKFFAASSQPHVFQRVPFELISLILILIAMALFYMMTLIAGIEALEHLPDEPDRQEETVPDTG